MPPLILRIAVPSPLRRCFDYLPPAGMEAQQLQPGMRLRVPFGTRTVVGVLLETGADSTLPKTRLKPAIDVLDDQPLIPAELLELTQWAAAYYQHPLGEVLAQAMPPLLRRGRASTALKALRNKGWIETQEIAATPGGIRPAAPLALNPDQQAAVHDITAALHGFQPFLLEGVTGSGKTEVYLTVIEAVVAAGRQALVLLPEIGLTPQMIARFRARLHAPVTVYHSGLSERERLAAWTAAGSGTAAVVLGTRSAVFVPLARPGVCIIDEEHDASYKQQDGFRYHARDVAVLRAQRNGVPIVLGSATPSIETLYNVQRGRYRRLALPERAGGAVPPRVRLLDIRGRRLHSGMAEVLLEAMGRHLDRGEQVLVFINRRGYAPTILCHDCAWVACCLRCDARLVLHQSDGVLRCHHCGARQPAPSTCPACRGTAVRALGHGTERIEQALRQHFPQRPVLRIDRDTTRRKGAMQSILEQVQGGSGMILIGTQMLAKGHHLPDVTLVAVLNADTGLFSADFRAPERMAQTIVQVAGRAGRSDKPGTVIIQTHHPEHPLMLSMADHAYQRLAVGLLEERRQAELPPYSSMALLRAESTDAGGPGDFLDAARDKAENLAVPQVQLLGPVPAPMARRAGRYRAHLLIQAGRRHHLHRLLAAWVPLLEGLPTARKVRWSLDVDPMELL